MASGINATEQFVKCYSDIPHGVIASPKEEQGKEEEHRDRYGIALFIAQADGQMQPGVSSTKDNSRSYLPDNFQMAPADSVRPYDTEAPPS